ncbi:sensor histidine kinase [Acrocarpospora catenulata]|uniref:sensor histidine kinase n=1 Tax=Acrocarpospora catenulata TaxID=2836182 RepID=UPI001BDA0D71|nr:nitrate- and nitrite sensing domain-containing protein [Acrocarpospora catenulata]
MRFRNSRVRAKVAAMLVSLAALWAFAAWVTVREGVNLLGVASLDSSVVAPSEPLLVELQKERRLSMVYLGSAGRQPSSGLGAQRARTDALQADYEESARSASSSFYVDANRERAITDTFQKLTGLASLRKSIDDGRVGRVQAAEAFTDIIESVYRMYDSMATLDDEAFARDTRTLLGLSRAREILAREDATLAGAIAAGRFSNDEHAQFVQIMGAQRFVTDQMIGQLTDADRQPFEKVLEGSAFTRLRALESAVAQSSRAGFAPPVNAEQWQSATDAAQAELQKAILSAGDDLVDRATPIAVGVVVRLVLAGGLGLIAVITSVILSITTARALVQQLEKLRTAALELAHERLPSVVDRLARGEKVDVEAEAPPLQFGGDVIGQVGQAFNAVQQTAVRTAVEEAELRQSIRDILLSLARRTQSLVHRQLTLLDVMERRENEPEELNDLFRVDHLATRMRRNAENLIVLSGSSPARAWRNPVPMVDVVRGALGEVEDFTRVTVLPMGKVELTGRAVGDVIHLLAELVENAVSFSPPYTVVQVSGQMVANGYAIEIEDRGLGMTAEDLDVANQRIMDPPEFNLSTTARLGLFVVSKLAERHGIRVQLKASPYGGTTAVVLLPRELVIEDDLFTLHPAEQVTEMPRMAVVTQPQGSPEPLPRPPQPPLSAPVVAPIAEQRRRPELVPDTPPLPTRVPEAPVPEPAPESFTPSGLPFRVPQASITPALREVPKAQEEEDDDRSPEDIRKIMGSYQSGTRRGRSEAARLLGQQKDDEDNR